jgi:hypothetical protein
MRLPTWEQLSEALQRVMAAGVSERKAKRDICEGIANGEIRLRFYFMVRPTRMDFLTGRSCPWRVVRCVKGNDIPPILRPGDFVAAIKGPETRAMAKNTRSIEFFLWKLAGCRDGALQRPRCFTVLIYTAAVIPGLPTPGGAL